MGSLKTPILETLNVLKWFGYTRVEGWNQQLVDVDQTAKALTETAMTMPTMHMSLDRLEQTEAAFSDLDKLGVHTVICPMVPSEDYKRGKGDWHKLADQLANLSIEYRKAGFNLAYHNHDWEFAALPSGETPIDIILAEDVLWEFDVAWAVKADQDPEKLMKKFGSKIIAIHMKDIAVPGTLVDGGWSDVGYGILNWPKLFASAKATHAEHFILEHDSPSDPLRFAKNSFEFTKTLK